MSILYKLGLRKIHDLKPKKLVDETKKILEGLLKDNKNEERKKQRTEQLQKLLEVIKQKIGDSEKDSIALAFYEQDGLIVLVENFHLLEFEARKLVSRIFVELLTVNIDEENLLLKTMKKHEGMISILFSGFGHHDNAQLMCEMLMNSCTLHPEISQSVLDLPNFYDLFKFLRSNDFEVASESLKLAKALFLTHKSLVSPYINKNFDRFFNNFVMCLGSESNFLVLRQCTKLLCELLMEEEYRDIMYRFINEEKYLRTIMGLLTHGKQNIRLEAFHIFKLFVGNPKKTTEVYLCLKRNQANFLTLFETFPINEESAGLVEDRKYVLKKIKCLDEDYKKSLKQKEKEEAKKTDLKEEEIEGEEDVDDGQQRNDDDDEVEKETTKNELQKEEIQDEVSDDPSTAEKDDSIHSKTSEEEDQSSEEEEEEEEKSSQEENQEEVMKDDEIKISTIKVDDKNTKMEKDDEVHLQNE